MCALRRCGIKERIAVIKGKPDALCRSLAGKGGGHPDWLRWTGGELAELLSGFLRSYGVRPNIECRRMLRHSPGITRFEETRGRTAGFH